MIGPIAVAGGLALLLAALAAARSSTDERAVPSHAPDAPATAGKTGWRHVDAILDMLADAARTSAIPLGLLVGWIAKESGGLLEGWGSPRAKPTKYDERGFFQLMPDESKALGLDHGRLSTDPVYSINAGLLLIGKYMHVVDALGVAPRGSSYYWRLVKLCHTMGSGATQTIVSAAKAAGATGSWDALRDWALAHNAELLRQTKHSPAKWFPLVDEVYRVGAPFGFGTEGTQVLGSDFDDIIDPLDALDEVERDGIDSAIA